MDCAVPGTEKACFDEITTGLYDGAVKLGEERLLGDARANRRAKVVNALFRRNHTEL